MLDDPGSVCTTMRCGGSENLGTVGPFKDMHDYDPSLKLMMIMLKGESNANKPTLEISSKSLINYHFHLTQCENYSTSLILQFASEALFGVF